jgi:hypothetical protein
MGWCGLIGLAKDRNRWRALVNSILNLRVPWNAGKLSSGLTSSDLSSSAQLHIVSYVCIYYNYIYHLPFINTLTICFLFTTSFIPLQIVSREYRVSIPTSATRTLKIASDFRKCPSVYSSHRSTMSNIKINCLLLIRRFLLLLFNTGW